jgi:hypothetical protein
MKVRIPLTERTVRGTACPRPEVTIRVRSRYRDFFPMRFAIDTGADVTAILIPRADSKGIPYQKTRPGRATGMVGTAAEFRDTIRVFLAGREYDWPCNFIEATGALATSSRERLPVLGRAGFLDAFNFGMGDGYFVLTRRGSLYHLSDRFWSLLGRAIVRRSTAAEPL